VAPTCLLSPFPLAGPLVVVGKTALDHIAAPLIARHDEGSEIAAAEAKRAERHHNDDLQPQLAHHPSLGLFQQLRQLGDVRRDPPRLIFAEQLSRRSPPRLTFIIHVGNLLTVGVTHD